MSDLREALKSRGLDAKGNKALLKERLIEALAAEKETTVKDDTGGANDSSDDDDADDSISEPRTPTNGNMSSDEVGMSVDLVITAVCPLIKSVHVRAIE